MNKQENKFIMFMLGILIFLGLLTFGCDSIVSDDAGTTTDVSTTDISTTDISTTDISTTDVSTTDVSTTDTGSQDTTNSENIVHESGESITESQKWSGTHILEGNLYIKASVEISPCTKILVAPGAKISVSDSGSIKSIGTKDCPVVFTSSKSSRSKGDWRLIEIYEKSSSDNAFDYTILEYGGEGDYGILWIDGGASVAIDNTTFDNSSSYGVYFDEDAKIKSFNGNKFTNIDLNPIYISPNEVGLLGKIETANNTNNSVLVSGGTVNKAAKWKNIGIPYFIKQNTYIKAGVEIEAGNIFYMGDKTKISVSDNGFIKSLGTQDKPILFTSSKSEKAAGDWNLIEIYSSSSSDNKFEYTTLEFGGSGDYGLLWIDDDGASVSIDNTTFNQSASYGLYIDGGGILKSFTKNKFTSISKNPITLEASEIYMLDKIETEKNINNVVLVRGGSVSKGGIWKNIGIPYEIKKSTYIKSPIEVDEGTTLLIGPLQKITISDKGSLRLKGSSNANITIKSAKQNPSMGDWYEIDIYQSADNNNIWDYVNIMHGGGNNYGQVWVDEGITLTLNNCKFSDSKDCDLYVENGGNVINNNSTYKLCPKK